MNDTAEIIDRKAIKSLASDTRVAMLKRLAQRRWMPSELSRDMNLAPSTVVEHLKALESAGLVRKEKTQRKWIYYALTERGENLFKPRIPFQFVLSLTFGILISVISLYSFYELQLQQYTSVAYPSGSDTTTEVRDAGIVTTVTGPTEPLKAESPPVAVAGISQDAQQEDRNVENATGEKITAARSMLPNEFSTIFILLAALGILMTIATVFSIYRMKKLG